MGYDFISRVSSANQLKEALDAGSQRVRAIADQVSKASMQNQDGFALPPIEQPGAAAAAGTTQPVNLETEMTNLADAQLRYEATAKLLAKVYAQIHTSLRSQ